MRVLSRLALVVALLASIAAPAAAEKFKPFTLKTPDGHSQPLASVLAAGKATLVVFFFPTCPYCNAAFPHVQKLYETYKPQGLSMVWVNVVPDEEKQIGPWQMQHGYTVPVLLGKSSTPEDYNLRMTPTHVLLDGKGDVLWKHAGYTPGDENTLEQQIQQALAH
jgi:thiol-disulfide isomerase/thioredoxin